MNEERDSYNLRSVSNQGPTEGSYFKWSLRVSLPPVLSIPFVYKSFTHPFSAAVKNPSSLKSLAGLPHEVRTIMDNKGSLTLQHCIQHSLYSQQLKCHLSQFIIPPPPFLPLPVTKEHGAAGGGGGKLNTTLEMHSATGREYLRKHCQARKRQTDDKLHA